MSTHKNSWGTLNAIESSTNVHINLVSCTVSRVG